jgi:Xaa-Pro aminopeptidase
MKQVKIDNSLFKRNRKKLIEALPEGAVAILTSNYQMPKNGDQFFNFRQNSNLFYLSGIQQEKTTLLIQKLSATESKEHLFVLKSCKEIEVWEGHKLTFEEATEISGITNIHLNTELNSFLRNLALTAETFYLDYPENPRFNSPVITADVALTSQIKKDFPLHKTQRLAPILTQLRLKKEPAEIELMKKAIDITAKAFEAVKSVVRPEMMEYEIEAELIYQFIRLGAAGHAFSPIIASGKNACVLHYETNHDKLKNGELLLMDFGADYANYAADCSRTIPINGNFTKRQEEFYRACLDAFNYAREQIIPGETINGVNEKTDAFLADKFIELGLYSSEELKQDAKLVKKYFPHGTSHFLGLDTHDVGGKEVVFESGMVLTCEPGIYIEEEEIGIRLENDILISEKGNIDLMEQIPFEF